jgi:hypothetical protein
MEEIYILLKRCPRLDSLITVSDGLMGKTGLWILQCRMELSNRGRRSEIREFSKQSVGKTGLLFFFAKPKTGNALTHFFIRLPGQLL